MIARWFASSRRRSAARSDRDDEHQGRAYYECTYCQRTVAEWSEDCPRCGQLVVRIVEPSG